MNKQSEKLKVKGEKYKICATDFEGITLVALVITIIVLIILAGVSINAVMNQGLIKNAKDASGKWDNAVKGELSALAQLELIEQIPQGAEVIQGDSDSGIVMKDSNGNEWVWIEVPKTIYTTATSSTDYVSIENDMKTYTSGVTYENYMSDVWCDYFGTVWDGKSNYGYGNGLMNAENLATAEANYGAGKLFKDSALTTVITSSSVPWNGIYYVEITEEILEDTTNFGLTGKEYYSFKQNMLKSVYENEGFWVGRYEAGVGTDTGEISTVDRTAMTEDSGLTKAVLKQNAYPYNYISSGQAQKVAKDLATGGRTSSLMFPIQWKLMLKCIKEKGYDLEEYGNTGNLMRCEIEIQRGKSLLNNWNEFDYSWTKTAGLPVLLTTGATDSSLLYNTYDLSGNVSEYLLGCHVMVGMPTSCQSTGGSYKLNINMPTLTQPLGEANTSDNFGFRPVMW